MSGLKRRLRGSLTVQKIFTATLDESVVGLSWVQGGRLAALTAAGSVWLADGTAESLRRIGGHAEARLFIGPRPAGPGHSIGPACFGPTGFEARLRQR